MKVIRSHHDFAWLHASLQENPRQSFENGLIKIQLISKIFHILRNFKKIRDFKDFFKCQKFKTLIPDMPDYLFHQNHPNLILNHPGLPHFFSKN